MPAPVWSRSFLTSAAVIVEDMEVGELENSGLGDFEFDVVGNGEPGESAA
jgi:hypothetical protein